MAKQADQALLEEIAKALVNNPDSVKVERTVDEMGVLLTLKVDPQDMGQIIGREGNTVKAVRTIMRVVGMKARARVNLRLYQPEGSEGPGRKRKNDGDLDL
ncbi:MAG: KH domain-containing protein [Parcubacteria group bacterium]|nr:KH domain-containing protein [Parcubacteria group bacterium]